MRGSIRVLFVVHGLAALLAVPRGALAQNEPETPAVETPAPAVDPNAAQMQPIAPQPTEPPLDPAAMPAPVPDPSVVPTPGAEGAVAPPDGAASPPASANTALLTPELRAQLTELLRQQIAHAQQQLSERLAQRIAARQEESMGRVANALFLFSLLGFVLLFRPLWLARRFPGKTGLLYRYSAIASVTFFVAVNVFAFVLVLLRAVQGELGKLINPQLAIVDATFEALRDNVDEIAALGPTLIAPTLQQVQSQATDTPLAVALVQNITRYVANAREAVDAFQSIADAVSTLDEWFGYVPVALTLSAVGVFVWAMRGMLRDIVDLPVRAASGEEGAARRVLAGVGRRIVGELLATVCLVFVLVIVMALAGSFLGATLKPCIETFLEYLLGTVLYVQAAGSASGTVILTSLGATVAFLGLNMVVILATSLLYMAKVQRILRLRFQDGVKLGAHRKFWLWGTGALLLNLAFPVIYVNVARPLVDGPISSAFAAGPTPDWEGFLLTGPFVMVVGYLFCFWLARGVKALRFLAGYRAVPPGTDSSTANQPPHALAA